MPGITVDEPLNPSEWTPEQQLEVRDACNVLLGETMGCDYAAMTDQELSDSLNACSAEISTRPAATTQAQNAIAFMGDTVVIPVEAP